MNYLKKLLLIALLSLTTILTINTATAAEFDHSIWQGLLQKNVVLIKGGQASQVNYEAMLKVRPQLQKYLSFCSMRTMLLPLIWC